MKVRLNESLFESVEDVVSNILKNKQYPRKFKFLSSTGDSGEVEYNGRKFAFAKKKNGDYKVMDSNKAGWNWSETLYKDLDESANDPGVAFSAYITNLGKYNEGELVGEWVDFPIDEDEFEEVLNKIGISDEPDADGIIYDEWFVTDYDSNKFDMYEQLGEYPSYDSLQEYGEAIADLDDRDIEVVEAIIEARGSDLLEAIQDKDDVFYMSGVKDDEDLGYAYVNEVDGGEITQDMVEQYFDYDQLGRDLSFDEYTDDEGNDITAGEYWCGDENASDQEIGEAYVNAVGIEGINNFDYFFDYDSYGHDISFEGTFTENGFLFD